MELRDEFRERQLVIKNSTQKELLSKTADDLSKILFIMTSESFRELDNATQSGDPDQKEAAVRGLPIKTITDSIDKLRRLQMHVQSGGVQKHAHLNINLSEDLLQDVIMEVCMEVERLYPEFNSRDQIRGIFSKHIKKILEKVS